MAFRGVNNRRIIPYNRRVTSSGRIVTLPFSQGTFANTSDRYILAKPSPTGLYSMTGPFGANVLATRNISGDVYGLFEKQYTTANNNDYSENMNLLYNTKSEITVTSDDRLDPLGNLTIDKICETSFNGQHFMRRYFNTTNGVRILYSFVAYPDERSYIYIYNDGYLVSGNSQGVINLNAHTYTVGLSNDGVAFAKCFELDDGGTLFVIAFNPDKDSTNARVQIYPHNGSSINYQGVTGYGFHMGFVNIIEADYPVSYIKTIGSPVTKAPDVFYFSSSVIPAWMKSKFTMKLIPNYDISATLGAAKTLWQCGTVVAEITATGHVLVRDGATPRVDSGAVTASMHQNLEIEFDRVNGKLTLSGFTTGNGETADTPWTEPASNFYYGCDSGSANQADALLSVPIG